MGVSGGEEGATIQVKRTPSLKRRYDLLLLLQDLERDDVLALLLSREVNRAKLAPPKRAPDLKIRNRPLFLVRTRKRVAVGQARRLFTSRTRDSQVKRGKREALLP